MNLLLIRHGESQQFFNRLVAGPKGCRGLTERGFEQARALAERLKQTGEAAGCTVFLTTPILRARQTAETIAPALPPGLRLVEDAGLCEIDPGDSDGLTKEEARARYGSFDLIAEPERPIAPGGESWQAFLTRVRAVLERLAAQYDGQTVVAVTHAGFIVAALLVLFDIPRPGTGAYLDPDFTGITEWHASGGKWKLVRYNDL